MTLPGLVAAQNLSDVADLNAAWNNIGANINATITTTNVVTRSENFAAAEWVKVGATVASNVTVAPDGTNTADKLIPSLGATGNARSIRISIDQPNNAPAVVVSIFAKSSEFTRLLLAIETEGGSGSIIARRRYDLAVNEITLTGGPVLFNEIINLDNGWSRLTMGVILDPAEQFVWRITTGIDAEIPDGTSGMFLWGASAEFSYFLTNYKPTSGMPATASSPISLRLTANDILALNGASRASAVDFIRTKGLVSPAQPRISAAVAATSSGTALQNNALLKASPVSEGDYALSRGVLDGGSLQVNGVGVASISGSPFSGFTATAPLLISSLGMPQEFRIDETMPSGTIAVPERAIPVETGNLILYAKAGQS
jgi:hypothetical protein